MAVLKSDAVLFPDQRVNSCIFDRSQLRRVYLARGVSCAGFQKFLRTKKTAGVIRTERWNGTGHSSLKLMVSSDACSGVSVLPAASSFLPAI